MNDDPGELSGIRIRTGDGSCLPVLTVPVFDGLLGAAADIDHPLLEVARGADEWIRVRLLPDRAYRLTHRAGARADEYEIYTEDPILLRDIVFAWIDRDPWWSDTVAWSRVDPAVAELESARDELSLLLEALEVFEAVGDTVDDALARADELLAGEWDPSDGADPAAR